MIVRLKRNGKFYSVSGDDCYILYYFFGYRIINNRLGFPKSVLSRVVNTLSENKISYEVVDGEKENFKKLNRYEKFLKSGREKYNHDIKFQNIIENLRNLSEEQLERILMFIEEVLNE